MKKTAEWLSRHEWATVALMTALFIALRLPGTDLPLHQDEYKWPAIVNPALVSDSEIPHPPLSQFIYRVGGAVVGYDVHFRFVPLFFGILNLHLLYALLRMRFGRREAVFGGLAFSLSYFSVLASLMVDTDGQIMPFFFLASLVTYFKAREASGRKRALWLAALAAAIVCGFFVKVSFLLAAGAIVADFIWENRTRVGRRDLARFALYAAGGIAALFVLLALAEKLFPFFDFSSSFKYWEHFANLDRNWLQTGIQVVKAVLYSSPFLVLVPFFLRKADAAKLRPFLFFLAFALVFYVALFDFSTGALDRYLQLLVVPLSALSAVALSKGLETNERQTKEFLGLGLAVAAAVFALQFAEHYVPSLYPKSDWIARVTSLRWNFLYPFHGGSGPLGFYISFLFIGLAWIASAAAAAVGFARPSARKRALMLLVPLGLVYNLTFAEEYLAGRVNGFAPRLVEGAVARIESDPDIKRVVVYNDNGGNEVQAIGKYEKRLYTSPEFDLNDKIATINAFEGHYLEVDVPRIDPSSVYRRYLDSCEAVYRETDRKMSATVYDCRNAPDIINER